MELYPERNPAAKLDSPVLITFRIQILSKRVSHVANTYNPFLSDIQANVELKGAEEQPLPTGNARSFNQKHQRKSGALILVTAKMLWEIKTVPYADKMPLH